MDGGVTCNLTGYSPRGQKESDTTEQLHFHFQHPVICYVQAASQPFGFPCCNRWRHSLFIVYLLTLQSTLGKLLT